MDTITRNENKAICSLCGKCCSHYAGLMHPDQMKEITVGSLVALFRSGYCVDYWEGDPRPDKDEIDMGYFIRPQHQGHEGKVLHASWGGEKCGFLTPTGCKLTFENRPHQCQALRPMKELGGKCTYEVNLGKDDYAIAWLPYYPLIEQAIEEFNKAK